MKRWFLVFCVLGCVVGCSSKSPDEAPVAPKKLVAPEPVEQAPEFPREVFGVPLPPQLTEVMEQERSARVATSMKLDEVRAFYETRLVDYEYIEVGKRIEIRPLRPYLPLIRLVQLRVRSPTVIHIQLPEAPLPPTAKVSYEPGEPVDFRLPTGELLAPGAIWGEPYTPPPGSPLANPRYKSNHGKPFGEWIPQ